MTTYTPRIEKRILPLLDITLILVGVLILVIGTPHFGEQRVFALELTDTSVLYGSDVVADQGQINQDVARRVVTLAMREGFDRIEIRIERTRHELSASDMERIERELEQISDDVATDLETNQHLTVRFRQEL